MRWPAEREKLFVMLWTQGLSPKEIAKKMGVSVSTIIGKRDRMNLPPREAAPETKKRLPPLVPVDRSRARGAERGPSSVRFIDRKPWQCPMFCSGEEGPEGFVCGAPAEFSVWCERCKPLVFVPAPPMRKVA